MAGLLRACLTWKIKCHQIGFTQYNACAKRLSKYGMTRWVDQVSLSPAGGFTFWIRLRGPRDYHTACQFQLFTIHTTTELWIHFLKRKLYKHMFWKQLNREKITPLLNYGFCLDYWLCKKCYLAAENFVQLSIILFFNLNFFCFSFFLIYLFIY